MMFTDPPYGIERDKGFGGFGGFGTPIARRQYADDWDSSRPEKETFDMLLGVARQSIIFGGNFFADILPQSKHWLVWDKLNTMPTFGDCELAWTNIDRHSVKKYTVQYNGLIGKEKERFHPTQKPVAIMAAILEDYTDGGDLILEPFSGSGTTIIACHNLNRKCRAIEISPGYVAVAIERFFQHSNILPVLISGAA
jgi:DNA modification methylase